MDRWLAGGSTAGSTHHRAQKSRYSQSRDTELHHFLPTLLWHIIQVLWTREDLSQGHTYLQTLGTEWIYKRDTKIAHLP